MSRVRLDLNDSGFQDDWLDLDANEFKVVARALRKLRKMEWDEVYRDAGLKWEAIRGMQDKYSIRLSIRARAIVHRQGDFIVFQAIHLEHDATYGRK